MVTILDCRSRSEAPVSGMVTALWIDECERDLARVAIPNPEMHLVARMGPTVPDGVDLHAFGARQTAHRKTIRGGQRIVFARLCLGTSEAVFGVSAAALAGRTVALDALWGEAATQQLRERLIKADGAVAAAAILRQSVIRRAVIPPRHDARRKLVRHVAARLVDDNVATVARSLGISARHLRRVFQEVAGISPKAYAKVKRFRRALHAARDAQATGWSHVAADAGYYDQAHLITEFKAIAGVTPRALLAELEGQGTGDAAST